jgi:hypothetical protein
MSTLVDQLAAAITREEGTAPGDRSTRNNNPGNLWDGSGTIFPSLPHDSGGFVIFPTMADGTAALQNDLNIKISRGLDLTGLLTAWAPPSENNTAQYIANVSSWTGIPAAGVPLKTLGTAPSDGGLSVPDFSNPIDPGGISEIPTGLDLSQLGLGSGSAATDILLIAGGLAILWAVRRVLD